MSTALSAPQQHLSVPPPEQAASADWKQQLAERLDSYRAKHSEVSGPPPLTPNNSANSRASRIARTVASRYATAPTYSELLVADAQAEEAFLAEQQAARAKEAARIAEQVRQAAELEQNSAHRLDSSNSPASLSSSSAAGEQGSQERNGSPFRTQPATPVMPQFAARSREMHLHQAAQEPEPSLEDLLASSFVEPRALLPSKLIEFPRELVSSHRARPKVPESSRLAENAGREQSPAPPEPEPAQLRIFEVQPEIEAADRQSEASAPAHLSCAPAESEAKLIAADPPISKAPANPAPTSSRSSIQHTSTPGAPKTSAPPGPAATQGRSESSSHPAVRTGAADRATAAVKASQPVSQPQPNSSPVRAFKGLEWAAISLDKEPAAYRRKAETSVAEYVPFMVEPASIDRRVMAFAVDFAAVTAGFLAFLAVFAASTPHLPTGLTAVALGAAVYASLWVLYQMLFFSLSGATAGMLYARIALCTFDDQNPTRSALRRRLAAWWLSCLPLCLGFLWCFVDEDNLCWHDRMTRMYQRAY